MDTKTFNSLIKKEIQQVKSYTTQERSFEDLCEDVTRHLPRILLIKSFRLLAARADLIAKDLYPDLYLPQIAEDTLINKAKEYSMNGDRLWNFRNNYKFMEKYPLDNLLGYLRKHCASCMDIIRGYIKPDRKLTIEKFGDVYCYCLLALAILAEEEKGESYAD